MLINVINRGILLFILKIKLNKKSTKINQYNNSITGRHEKKIRGGVFSKNIWEGSTKLKYNSVRDPNNKKIFEKKIIQNKDLILKEPIWLTLELIETTPNVNYR